MNDYRILVVDDEEDLCEILKFNLENEGYEVDTANSAEEALKMDISSYHLILLDVMMGEISGFKMANMLKKDKKTAHHLHHSQRYRKRYCNRLQSGSGRLYLQAFLPARSDRPCESRTEAYRHDGDGKGARTPDLPVTRDRHHQEEGKHR